LITTEQGAIMVVGVIDKTNTPMVMTFDNNLVEMIADALGNQIQMAMSVYQMFGEVEEEGGEI
jgi:hypothetical protein